jgi:acetoin utilization deacetylase AcuC-like enzyme
LSCLFFDTEIMWEETNIVSTVPKRKTGYIYEDMMMWHNSGSLSFNKWVEPSESWESPLTKSRINGLLEASGLARVLTRIRARRATKEEVLRFHTESYVDSIKARSDENGGDAGEVARFGHGGYEIALTSAGGVLRAVEAVMSDLSSEDHIDNAYCLVRPPGHHAERDRGRGFCIFNNIALAALHARHLHKQRNPNSDHELRVAIVDYDVHHGNGTQQAFWEDPNTLFISIHQDSNYPIGTGTINETGDPVLAPGSTINIPMPPGSGSGAYSYVFDQVPTST